MEIRNNGTRFYNYDKWEDIKHASYNYTKNGWNTKENFLKLKERDKYKNDRCKDKNIKLIRIPYTDFNILDFNYIKEII